MTDPLLIIIFALSVGVNVGFLAALWDGKLVLGKRRQDDDDS